MGYRDEIIGRMKKNGVWDALSPELKRKFEQYSEEQAKEFMVFEDDWDSNFATCTAEEMRGYDKACFTMMIVDSYSAFGGKLFARPFPERELSGMGRALVDFIAAANASGIRTLGEVHTGLASLTMFGLMGVQKAAKLDAGDAGLAE